MRECAWLRWNRWQQTAPRRGGLANGDHLYCRRCNAVKRNKRRCDVIEDTE